MMSIVVVNWNTSDLLDQCLNSIYQQTEKGLMEIIVIDNHSSDDSCDMVKKNYPEVILLENDENRGFAAANNQGFEIAKGKYVLMLNSDTIILDNAIEKVLDYAERNQDVAALGCKILFPDMSFQNSCFRFPSILSIVFDACFLSHVFRNSALFNRDRYGNCEWSHEKDVDCVMGCFLFVKREVLEDVKYLDTDYFMFGEEADLCYKIKKRGGIVRYYPDAKIIHIWAGSQKKTNLSSWAYISVMRGILLFIAKNKSLAEAYLCNLIMLLMLFPRIIVWCFKDVVCVISKNTCTKSHLRKAKMLIYHLKVIFIPDTILTKWDLKLNSYPIKTRKVN